MDLRLGKNAVIFKDTFCLSKKKCTNGHNIHDTLVYGHWDTLQNWCLLQFSWKCDGFKSKYCNELIVLAKIASPKVLILVLALALALATACATRNWDLNCQGREQFQSTEADIAFRCIAFYVNIYRTSRLLGMFCRGRSWGSPQWLQGVMSMGM